MSLDSISPLPPLARTVFLERFAADPRADKLLLAGGTFKEERGNTPLLESVRIATERVHARGISRDYLPITGDPALIDAMEQLLFGATFSQLENRLRTAHTPGGTAALWIGANFLKSAFPNARIHVSDPTWGNHVKVFEQAGLEVATYPYYDAHARTLRFEEMLQTVEQIPAGEILFLQAATHNPTGLDPDLAQWRQLRDVVRKRRLLPFFDVAFFGFANGLAEDLAGLRLCCEDGGELLVATSLSKSMSLYNERVGTLSIVAASPTNAGNAFSRVEHLIRGSYSNPPLHGAAIAAEVLGDPDLFLLWTNELAAVRKRIAQVRKRFAGSFTKLRPTGNFSYISREHGLFTKFDLREGAIDELRENHALHLGSGGRCNVTAVPDARFEHVCDLIAALLE